jgi:hypothetical protein
MPNYCEIDFYLEGTAEQLHDVRQFIADHENDLSETLIPYPTDRQRFIDNFPTLSEEEKTRWMFGNESIEEAGSCQWFNKGGYEWCNTHWGSKWGLLDVRIDADADEADGYIKFTCKSAWVQSEPLLLAFVEHFKEIDAITITYFECGQMFHGQYIFEKGILKSHEETKYFGNRGG